MATAKKDTTLKHTDFDKNDPDFRNLTQITVNLGLKAEESHAIQDTVKKELSKTGLFSLKSAEGKARLRPIAKAVWDRHYSSFEDIADQEIVERAITKMVQRVMSNERRNQSSHSTPSSTIVRSIVQGSSRTLTPIIAANETSTLTSNSERLPIGPNQRPRALVDFPIRIRRVDTTTTKACYLTLGDISTENVNEQSIRIPQVSAEKWRQLLKEDIDFPDDGIVEYQYADGTIVIIRSDRHLKAAISDSWSSQNTDSVAFSARWSDLRGIVTTDRWSYNEADTSI